MFKTMMSKIKEVMYRMGLIKGIQGLSKHKGVPLSEEMHNHITMWRALYKGYHEPFHKLHYHTIEGPKTRRMDTMNMAKTASQEMASLIFNEKCEISIGDDKNETSEFIDSVFRKNKFNKKFQDFLEYSFAHGGMVVKPYVENSEVKLSFVTADCFIPTAWNNDTITEAVFINEFRKGDKKYTHLEWHLRTDSEKGLGYTIKNEVYESKAGEDLGVEVSLSEHRPGVEEEVGIHPLENPLFSYFKPNTANNFDTQSPLGISLYANALDTMRAIDTAFDSFHREFRLGKKRIIVPDRMLKAVPNAQTGGMDRYFDPSDETYEGFRGEMDDDKILDISVELRVEEHIAAINSLLNIFCMQTGFSGGTFTFDGQSMKTATEVISEQSKTFKSKQSHEIIIESGLQDLIESIINVAALYELFSPKKKYEVAISFDDSIAEDKNAEIDKQIKRISSGTQSRRRAIMKIEGVTADEADLILQEIQKEERRSSPEYKDIEREISLFGERE